MIRNLTISAAEDELFMMECLKLAGRGGGYVSPNPLVGAVVVKKGKVVGRGFHKYFGGPHAEVQAIHSSLRNPRGATLYVNLEPCNHHGKTGPCTDLIVKSGFRRVVIGMRDPNPLVRGRGINALRRAGIQVDIGILKEECEKLNESFAAYITRKTPFTAIKIAQTLDGRIAANPGGERWITNRSSRKIVHHLRSRYDAVLVGAGTVTADNPSLTVRHVKGRNPVRLILDGRLRSPLSSNVYRTARAVRTILITATRAIVRGAGKVKALKGRGVEILALKGDRHGKIPVLSIVRALGKLGIASVLVEGGAHVFDEFVAAGAVDKCYWFVAPKVFGNAPGKSRAKRLNAHIELTRIAHWNIGGDILIEGYVT